MNACARLLLLLVLAAAPAGAATYNVFIGDCSVASPQCFRPNSLTIRVGDTVVFGLDCDGIFDDCSRPSARRHNVAADDGSFRCARGCDDDGGDGAPAFFGLLWGFARTFDRPGLV